VLCSGQATTVAGVAPERNFCGMKDLKRLAIYGSAAGAAIALLSGLAESGKVSGDMMVIIALLLVVVVPLAAMVFVGRREHRAEMSDTDRR